MTIHTGHPFAEAGREPGRRFRGRLGGQLSLWTAGDDGVRAGLTVGSLLAVDGDPWRLVAALDPDADLTELLQERGRAVVTLLSAQHMQLAEAFGGGPAPGGPFRMADWIGTPWGPRPADADTWAGVELEQADQVGWGLLVRCRVAEFVIGPDERPLIHRRGHYQL